MKLSEEYLDQPCPACGRAIGTHTMREWAEHSSAPSHDLPYEEIPDGPIMLDVDGMPMVDHIDVRATVMAVGDPHAPTATIPAVIFSFSVGVVGAAPVKRAEVLFAGSPESLRRAGVVVRDACNGAANRVEKAG